MSHDAFFKEVVEATLELSHDVLHLHLNHPLHEILHDSSPRHVVALHWSSHDTGSLHDAHHQADVASYNVVYEVATKVAGSIPRERFAVSSPRMLAVVAALSRPNLEALVEIVLTLLKKIREVASSLLVCGSQGIHVRITFRVKLQCFFNVVHKRPYNVIRS